MFRCKADDLEKTSTPRESIHEDMKIPIPNSKILSLSLLLPRNPIKTTLYCYFNPLNVNIYIDIKLKCFIFCLSNKIIKSWLQINCILNLGYPTILNKLLRVLLNGIFRSEGWKKCLILL